MTEPTSPESDLRETLVAYLDGELNADEERRVEQLLSTDELVRGELQRLQSTWDLLDRLPRADVGAHFTRSTVEMVALSVEKELAPRRRRTVGRSPRVAAGLVAACIAGFLVTRFWPDRNRPLLDDLPLLEHLEAYRQTPDIVFLRNLQRADVFGNPAPPVHSVGYAERQARVASLPLEEKEDLLRRFERFQKLPAAEQQRLRRLDAEIGGDAQSDRLYAVLHSYQHWLDQLAGFERAELMALPAEQRLARIKQLREEEDRRLSPEDQVVFAQWVEAELLKRMNPVQRERFAAQLEQLPEGRRRQEVGRRLRALMQATRAKQLSDKAAERKPKQGARAFWNATNRQALAQQLSSSAGRQLEAAGHEAAQRKLIQAWTREVFFAPPGARNLRLPSPGVNNERMRAFFEHEITPTERAHLLSLPSDQMKRQLQRLYQQSHPK